jgi:hypothetical protein
MGGPGEKEEADVVNTELFFTIRIICSNFGLDGRSKGGGGCGMKNNNL